MKVQNKKVEVAKGEEYNDENYLNDLLSSLKAMAKNYTVMLTEASNEYLYKEYKKLYDDVINMQREIYLVCFQNGWYSLETVDSNKISTKLDDLSTKYNDLFA